MPVVRNTLKTPGGAPIRHARITARLVVTTAGGTGPGFVDGDHEIVGPHATTTDADGIWELTLPANDTIVPAGTVWRIDEDPPAGPTSTRLALVPDSAGPFELEDVLTDPPAAVAPSGLAAHQASDAAHAAAAITFDATGLVHTAATDVQQAVADLDGAVGAAVESPVTSVNSEIGDVLLDAADVGAAADDDPRLADARVPTAHAASHGAAGTDPATVAQGQVTGLAAALAALATQAALNDEIADRVTALSDEVTARNAAIAQAVADLIDGAPGLLDTFAEIATQLGADETAVAALTTTVAGKLAKASNLSDLTDVPVARTNLGLGAAATHPATDFESAGAVAAEAATRGAADTALDGRLDTVEGTLNIGGAFDTLRGLLALEPSTTDDEICALLIKAPDSGWGVGQDYGEGNAIVVLADGAGTPSTKVRFRVDHLGAIGTVGGIHVSPGANGSTDVPAQCVWIQPLVDSVPLVITNPPVATSPSWTGPWFELVDSRNANVVALQYDNIKQLRNTGLMVASEGQGTGGDGQVSIGYSFAVPAIIFGTGAGQSLVYGIGSNGVKIGNWLELAEVTAPSAPSTNNVRLFGRDDGSGNTEWCARFPTGAIVPIVRQGLTGPVIPTGYITSTMLLDGTILNADINAAAAIAYSKLALTGSILNADLAGSIAYSKLVLTGAVLNADLAGSIALTKLATQAASTFVANNTAGVAAPTAITVAQAKTLLAIAAGDVSGLGSLATLSTVGTATITDDSVTNAKLANVATATIKGRTTAGTGDPEDLTPTQAKGVLAITSSDVSGLGALATLSAVASAQITDGTILNGDISTAAAIALSKLATQADATIVGNNAGATGVPLALTASQVRTLLTLGGAALLNVGTTAGTVAAGDDSRFSAAVADDSITNAKLANVATATFKGRSTAGTGDPEDLSVATAKTLLAVVPGDITGFDTQVRTSRLDQMARATAGVPAGYLGSAPGAPTNGDVYADSARLAPRWRIGGAWAEPSQLLAEAHADTSASNTAAETSLFSTSIPGALLRAGDMIVLRAGGSLLQNSGGTKVVQMRLKLGATTVLDSGAAQASFASSASGRLWWVEIVLLAASTTAQRIIGNFLSSGASNQTWAGASAGSPLVGYGTATEDTSTAKTLDLTADWDSANASASITLSEATVLYFPKAQ